MTKFLLIRHAATDYAGKRLAGRMPGISLNYEGREQAQKLVERLTGAAISAIYSSPLARATETAAPLAEARHLSCNILDDFLEIDFGIWTNRTIQELENDSQFKLFNTFRSGTRIPGGETMAEVQLRIIAGIEKLNARHPGETIAIISHADVIRSAIAFYAGMHPDMLQRIEISPASVSIAEIYPDTARIVLMNDTGGIKA